MTVEINDVKILGKTVLVKEMEFGVGRTAGGIIRPDDDMKLWGARPRWAKVLAVGPDVDYVKPGQYINQAHGSWTRGFSMLENGKKIIVRMIDPKDSLLVADEPPIEYAQAEKI